MAENSIRLEGAQEVDANFPYFSRKMLTELDLMDFYLALESVGATEEEMNILKGLRKRFRKSEWKRIYDRRVATEMVELTADLKKLGELKSDLIKERNALLEEIRNINNLISQME